MMKKDFQMNQEQNHSKPQKDNQVQEKKSTPKFQSKIYQMINQSSPKRYSQQRKPRYTYVRKYDKINNRDIVNVMGDGNCFYRALAVAMGMTEDSYAEIKILLHDFLEENRVIFDYLGDIDELKKIIWKDREPAPFEVIYIATECFQKSIKLYYQELDENHAETFDNDFGPRDSNPIEILFVGPFQLGHFMAVLKEKRVATNNSQEQSVKMVIEVQPNQYFSH